ncbi:TPR domain protein [Penicillium paradoxum]|uniref:TPR domain protein n=1 Tax=Penicillium paradoxum TaxID=176176 RepID=UPI0025496F6C|nr:TPR domain protein [Penicillium paradoxum]KAJ5781090.1 TPR domain protein [Penicillium paradoxum]
MDTDLVPNVPGLLQHLTEQRQALLDAQSKKGQHPSATKSRDEIIMQFMHQKMSNKPPVGSHAVQTSFLPPAYNPCLVSLRELKKLMIKDLTLETHHRASYVLLRAVTPTDIMAAIMAIVEDENGDVVLLTVYHHLAEHSLDSLLCEGTILVVKEPYLKINADGGYGIRVDHFSDIMVIPEQKDLVPLAWRDRATEIELTASDWKIKGNELFQRSRYRLAIQCYSDGLESAPTNEEALILRLNRALASLRTHQFDAALRDLEYHAPGSEPSEKLLSALYSLQRFREACDVHILLSKAYPPRQTSKEEFDRALARLAEQNKGKYQFKKLHDEARRNRPINLDHATYIGPVTVKPTESCGRGLFTTQAVKPGDLLLCEKAFSYAFQDADEPKPNKKLTLFINPQTNRVSGDSQVRLLETTVQKLSKNPSLMSAFNDLYHGSYKPVEIVEVDGIPVVDTFLSECIISLNAFGCPILSHESHINATACARGPQSEGDQYQACGIWRLASYTNHSCNSNARRAFIGDMMIIRATRNLPPDSEITFWYKSPVEGGSTDEQVDLAHWGFKCTCVICHNTDETPGTALAKRKKLKADLMEAFESPGKPDTIKIEATIASLEDTYHRPLSEVPQLGIWDAYLALAMIYAVYDRPEKAIESAFRTLESLGYVIEGGRPPFPPTAPLLVKKWGLMMDGLVGCWMCLAGVYRKRYPWLVAQSEEYARISYLACIGEDETFKETYSTESGRPDGLRVSKT